MNNKREVIDTLYLVALQGINYVTPLLVFPYLMIVLGAEKFGYIGFSMSVIQYLMLFVDFGFNFTATKQISLIKHNQEKLNEVFTSTLYAKLILLIISFLVMIVISFIPRFESYRVTLYIMFMMVIGQAFTFVWLFQGLGSIRLISIFNIIAKISILPLTFIFVKNSDDYTTAAFLQAFVYVFSMLISLFYVFQKKWVHISFFIKKNILRGLKESFPIFLSNAATSIYTISFVIILGYFSSAEQVGQYTAVEKIMRAACYLIFVPISQAFYPRVINIATQNRKNAIDLVQRILICVFLIMMIVFIIMYFFSPYLVEFLGNDYKDTSILFKIISFVPIFVGTGGIVAQLGLLALGNDNDKKRYQQVYFIAAIVALLSVFITIPLYGANGAAVSLLITEISVCVLMIWYGRKIIFGI